MVILTAALCVLVMFAGCGKEKEKEKESKYDENVTLGDYKNMEVTVEKDEVTEEAIKQYVEQMITYYPAYESTDKTVVEDGDSVNIDYQGIMDGEAFEGGTDQGYVLKIGSNSFIDGFETGLIGAKVGDKLALNLTFPDPYKNNPDMAGKAVVFNVTVNAIVQPVEMTYETITDEYVVGNLASMGFDTVQALKDGVKEYLSSMNDYYAENDTRTAIIEKLKESCTVNVPEELLDERVNKYKEQFAANVKEQYQMEVTEYLKQYNMTEEDFNTDTVENMKDSLETELILLAIGEKEGMEVDEEGYQEFISDMLSNSKYESEEDLYEDYGEDYVKDSYICNKVMEMLTKSVKVSYTAKSEDAAAE